MFIVLALLLPLLSLFAANKILVRTSGRNPAQLAGGGGAPPLRGPAGRLRGIRPLRGTFLKNYAFALAASLALTYLLAAGTVSRLAVTDVLLGRLENFSSEILTLSAVLLASNFVVALSFVVNRGGEVKLRRPKRSFAVWATLFAVLVLLRLSLFWAFRTFPLGDANMLFGVLGASLGNTPKIFAKIWAREALIPAILVSAALMPALLLLGSSKTSKKFLPASCVFLLLLTLYGTAQNVPLLEYYHYWQNGRVNKVMTFGAAPREFSAFFKTHYVFPDSVEITAPAQKRNLIFIFLESMEVSFQDSANGGLQKENLIPELSEIARQNLNFSGGQLVGGGLDLTGTGWTIAATLAKLHGVPLYSSKDSYQGVFKNAVGLTDILARAGYNQSYVIGSEGRFCNSAELFRAHGNIPTKDLDFYRRAGRLQPNYKVHWGFEDSKLWQFFKEELDSLSQLGEPFAAITFTMDTHFPSGWFDESECPEFVPADGSDEEHFRAALKCASRQVGKFMAWAEEQPWFGNTLIVIVGDHLWPKSLLIPEEHRVTVKDLGSIKATAAQNDLYRRWLCVYVNSTLKPETRFRQFSSFDIFPTTLEALGFDVPGHALGFGRSLFSSEPTLVEKFGEEEINRNFTKRTPEYLYLMDLIGKN